MRQLQLKFCGLLVLGLLAVASPRAQSQDSKTGATVQVRVNYSGSGTVDENHKIYVALWDSPAFVEEDSQGKVMPIDVQPVSSKHGTAVFTRVSKSPAYVSAAYDPNGQWDAKSGPPPTGSSLGLYSVSPGKPEPIKVEAGKKVSVDVSFDDSIKMH
jgi:hypothetical protein